MVDREGAAAPSRSEVSSRMSRQRTQSTSPEMALRRALHARGLRYRVHIKPITGLRRTADIAFTRKRLAIMVDGCFWHGCPDHGTWPKSNRDWWAAKITRNRERDAETDRLLVEAGWAVMRVWEHDDAQVAAERVGQWLATH